MIEMFLAVSLLSQVNLFPPIKMEQDFLRKPIPKISCASIRMDALSKAPTGILLYGEFTHGTAFGITGHFDNLPGQDLLPGLTGIVEWSLAKPILDFVPAIFRKPCS